MTPAKALLFSNNEENFIFPLSWFVSIIKFVDPNEQEGTQTILFQHEQVPYITLNKISKNYFYLILLQVTFDEKVSKFAIGCDRTPVHFEFKEEDIQWHDESKTQVDITFDQKNLTATLLDFPVFQSKLSD